MKLSRRFLPLLGFVAALLASCERQPLEPAGTTLESRTSTASAATPKLIRLGSLGGGFTYPSAINEHGHVVGSSYTTGGERHAFLWTPQAGMQDLGTLQGDDESWAFDINNRGQIIGQSSLTGPGGGVRAVLWDNGELAELMPPGMTKSGASGINDAGQVALTAYQNTSPGTGFVWSEKDGFTPLGFSLNALDINNRGDVVGQLQGGGGYYWSRGAGMIPIQAVPVGLNDVGQAVGDVSGTAFVWSEHEGVVPLPSLSQNPFYDEAFEINNRGQIVGYCFLMSGEQAVIWSRDGSGLESLPGLEWATGINQRGQVIGIARVSATVTEAVIWQPNGG